MALDFNGLFINTDEFFGTHRGQGNKPGFGAVIFLQKDTNCGASSSILKKALQTVSLASMKKAAVSSILLVLTLLAVAIRAEAREPEKVYRIGYLSNAAMFRENAFEGRFLRYLREYGYVEGENLVVEWRFSEGKHDRLPGLAADLVRLKVDCIVAVGVNPALAAKKATITIPIVMGNADDDPIRYGLVATYARPGGNVTGFINIGSDLAGKRLELLKETVPKASRVAIIWDPKGRGGAGHARETKTAAQALKVDLQSLEVRNPEELENAFRAAVKDGAEALIVVHTGIMLSRRARVLSLALKTRLPAMYTQSLFANAGGLMSYDADPEERYRGTATYVDKILKGVKPSDLPVQQPTRFNLIVNLNTAKQIDLTIPRSVLTKADKLIR